MEIAILEILEKADFSPVQVKAIAQAIEQSQAKTISKETFDAHRQQLATREDLYKVKGELETKMEQNSLKLVQWVVGLMIAQTGIIIALIRLLPHS